MEVKSVPYVSECDLKHFKLRDFTYEGPPYGDASVMLTLVHADVLVGELEEKGDPKYQPLIDELNALPDGVLVSIGE